jgi:hypothetical protein
MIARDAQATDQGLHRLVILICHDCSFRPMGPASEGSRFNKKSQRNLGDSGIRWDGDAAKQLTLRTIPTTVCFRPLRWQPQSGRCAEFEEQQIMERGRSGELAKCFNDACFEGPRGRERDFLDQRCEFLGLLGQRRLDWICSAPQ